MGFVMGSSNSFVQSPIQHYSFLPFPSSSTSSQSLFFCSCSRNGQKINTKTKNRVPMCSFQPENDKDGGLCKRRAVLFLGFSVLPFMQLKARALEGVLTDEREAGTLDEKDKGEREISSDAASNPFLSLINGIGIFSSGVIGAFYAIARQEKTAAEETIKSIKNELNKKEATIVLLKNEYETKLQNEREEQTKQLNNAKEEQQALMDQLNSANSTITRLGQELQREKRLIEDLKMQIVDLQTNLSKAGEDKHAIEEKLKEKLDLIEVLQERTYLLNLEVKEKVDLVQSLSSSISEKELEFNKLNTSYNQCKDELAKANLEIKGLKEELVKVKEELVLKISTVDDLNARISTLTIERDVSKKANDEIQKKYNDLKSSSETKATLAANLLEERERKLSQLREQLELALSEASKSEEMIANMTQDKEDLKRMLDLELNSVKNLKHELHFTQESLEKLKNEAADLAKQLQQSRNLCSDVEAEALKVRTEFTKTKESLHRSLDEAKQRSEMLARELMTANELLKKTQDQRQSMSDKLVAAEEKRDGLQKELVDVYKKAEFATNELKEEKKAVSSLTKQLQAVEKQIVKDKETRKSLEIDLEEATKSLDEMNRNALLLSRDLEFANTRISSLEDEKDVLYKSLAEQKQISQEVRDNMDDAHNLVMKLGKERASFEKRGKKLEEELASAKGEILRLRSQINSSKVPVNDHRPKGEEPEEEAVVVSAKKTTRRKKTSQQ